MIKKATFILEISKMGREEALEGSNLSVEMSTRVCGKTELLKVSAASNGRMVRNTLVN